jgi:hypothetical protein
MNNEQIKQTIDDWKEIRKILVSFILPIFTGEIIALVTKSFERLLYVWLGSIGLVINILIIIAIIGITKKIKSFIKQLV